jgi:hypothetical protein
MLFFRMWSIPISQHKYNPMFGKAFLSNELMVFQSWHCLKYMRHSSTNGGVFATCDVKVVMGLETLPFESLF